MFQRVCPYSSDPEMNRTSSFLVQSDKLAIGPHLLLAPAGTVVKPTDHEVVRRLSPTLLRASQCSQQNRRSKLYSVCGRIMA